MFFSPKVSSSFSSRRQQLLCDAILSPIHGGHFIAYGCRGRDTAAPAAPNRLGRLHSYSTLPLFSALGLLCTTHRLLEKASQRMSGGRNLSHQKWLKTFDYILLFFFPYVVSA